MGRMQRSCRKEEGQLCAHDWLIEGSTHREERRDSDGDEDEVHRLGVSLDGGVPQVVRERLDIAHVRANSLDDLSGSLAGDDLGELLAKGVLENRGRERDSEDRARSAEEVGDTGGGGHVLGLYG